MAPNHQTGSIPLHLTSTHTFYLKTSARTAPKPGKRTHNGIVVSAFSSSGLPAISKLFCSLNLFPRSLLKTVPFTINSHTTIPYHTMDDGCNACNAAGDILRCGRKFYTNATKKEVRRRRVHRRVTIACRHHSNLFSFHVLRSALSSATHTENIKRFQ